MEQVKTFHIKQFLGMMSELYCTLKKEHGEYVNENKVFLTAFSGYIRWERVKEEERLEKLEKDALTNQGRITKEK